MASGWSAPSEPPAQRIRGATARRLPTVRELYRIADVRYPPAQLLLRGFKRERRLEVWAASGHDEPLHPVTTYEICFASGTAGPKRREGDRQVPEGFYVISAFNGASRFHLSMLVSYPNLSDRKLGDPRAPGGEIMIHGNCVSAGCLAMSDERMEELWVMSTAVRDRGSKVQVHLFPTRQLGPLIASGEHLEHQPLWRDLQLGLERFERTHRVPTIRVGPDGRYRFQ